jgi:hypothetical protein
VNLIRKAWETYDRNVVPKDAGDAQRLETRRAFFAGAMALQSIHNEIAQPHTTEQAAFVMLSAIQAELADFRAGIGRGN